jgi:hypothetical protein
MKALLLFSTILLFSTTTTLNAQSGFTLEATQQYTTFSFTDSQGNQMQQEYSGMFSGAYSVGYSYVSEMGFMLRTGIGMRNAGANLVYDEMNYSWKLLYAESKLGIGYMYITDVVNPYLLASGYYSYLLNGIQVLNNEQFNITKAGLLSNTDYGLVISPGAEIYISPNLAAFVEFKYLMGLQNIETSENQKAYNRAYGISAGLAIKF